jgi:hypothetical protein
MRLLLLFHILSMDFYLGLRFIINLYSVVAIRSLKSQGRNAQLQVFEFKIAAIGQVA